MSFFEELKRRKVLRVAALYIAGAFAVLQGADVLVEALRLPERVLTGLAIVAIVGLPVSLVLAWVYDLAPGGPAADGETGRGDLLLPPRTILLVVVLLLVGVGLGWFLRPGSPGTAAPGGAPTSIAVLPFENASADPEDEFFGQGVAEDLIYALDRLPGLEVKARTTTWQFAGANVSARQIADSVGASTVLAGRVRRSGDNLRISVELVRGSDGGILWQDRYEGPVADLFATQARIAEAIAGTLQIRLEADERTPVEVVTGSPEAYESFLRGRYDLALRNVPAIESAIGNFEAAIAADSAFALAWAGLGEAWMLGAVYHMPRPASELWRNANAAARRATELDPGLPQPYATRGYVRYWVGRWEDAVPPLERALDIAPDYTDAMQWLAEAYSRLGRAADAERLIQRALDREPYSRGVTSAAFEVYSLVDLEEASGYARRLLELGQRHIGLESLWYTLLRQGRFAEARERAREWVDALGLPPSDAAGAVAALDATFADVERFQTTGEPGTVHPGLVNSPHPTRALQVMVGRPEIAIAEIDSSLRTDHVHAMGVLQLPSFWALRDDPRIRALRQRLAEAFADGAAP